MAYLRLFDYHTIIAEANLEIILKQARGVLGDSDILGNAERNNIAHMSNSLRGRYKVDEIFASFQDWNFATEYVWNERIDFTGTDFSASTVYTSGDLVLYAGNVYHKNATTGGYVAGTLPTNATYFTNRGAEGIYYITPPEAYDEFTEYAVNDKVSYDHKYYILTVAPGEEGIAPTDTSYWERITDLTAYSVVGHWPNETAYWTFADNRDASIVECLVDMTLYDVHAVINPRNVPALRADRYTKCRDWLKDIRDGKLDMNLPDKGGQVGYRIRFGSNEQNVNYY